jgi:hypothetical protein
MTRVRCRDVQPFDTTQPRTKQRDFGVHGIRPVRTGYQTSTAALAMIEAETAAAAAAIHGAFSLTIDQNGSVVQRCSIR